MAKSEGEWNGLDALLAAKPIDLNGVRDSEYFGAQRMSFYMSPPKEAPTKTTKYDRPSVSNKENRVNNAVSSEPKLEMKQTALPKYTKRLFDKEESYSSKDLPPAYPEPFPITSSSIPTPSSTSNLPPHTSSTPLSTPSSTSSSSSIPISNKPSGLAKPRAKSSTLSSSYSSSSSYLSTPFSSSSSISSTPSATPASSFSSSLTTPATPNSSISSIRSSKTLASPAPTPSGIPSFSSSLKGSSIPSYTDSMSTPARPPLSYQSQDAQKSSQDDLLRRIAKLEEENRQLKETVEQSDREKTALTERVSSLEQELHTFMVEVQVVLLALKH
eukprot:Phypoly_transcript_11417.p1 GENE.Phypoly_transcript_11417~~Phypoly_transcript_11417.p1  ORF type:complete len:337 (+),score=95.04 Phypoly_transcript_11417:25-1011(+)